MTKPKNEELIAAVDVIQILDATVTIYNKMPNTGELTAARTALAKFITEITTCLQEEL